MSIYSGLNTLLQNYQALKNSPEFIKYTNSGRLPSGYLQGVDPKRAIQIMNADLARLRNEDKSIANQYELATGQKADQSTIDKFGQYASDPALLQAALSKASNIAPASGTFNDQINSTLQDKLGRPATQAELGYFGKQMEAGNLDAYGLQDFLQGTTEYQNKASNVARTKLAGDLGNIDTQYLGKVEKGLQSKYAEAGRPGAGAYGSALIGAGKDLATQRTGYLAGLGYQDFQSGQENLKAAYQNRLSQMYANQQNQTGLANESRQRYYANQDATQQQAAAERIARLSQPRPQSFLQGLIPGVISAGASLYGSYLGKPQITNNYSGWSGTPYK